MLLNNLKQVSNYCVSYVLSCATITDNDFFFVLFYFFFITNTCIAYNEYKQIANAECPRNPWKIQKKSLFTRLDAFLERCSDNLNIAQTVVQFSQLADIEIGGTQGKVLSVGAQSVWTNFQKLTERFLLVDYDLMDVTADGFASDFYHFRQSVKELERRLSSLIGKAFDDGACTRAKFNLLDSFHQLLNRPNIESDMEKRYV